MNVIDTRPPNSNRSGNPRSVYECDPRRRSSPRVARRPASDRTPAPIGVTVLIVATACLMAIANVGCQPAANSKANLDVDLTLDPSPPAVGENQISLHLKDAKGSPIQGATVHVEGNMNHAGMKPSLAELHETGPGKYGGTLRFTMGGDWYFLITAELPDGKVVEKTIEVPGVLSQ